MILRRVMALLFVLTFLLPCAASADDTLARALARQLQINRSRYDIAGQALLVAHNGRVLFRGADGEADIETHARVTVDDVFPGYSISKLFVSALIMQLVEQDQLDLDLPASAYLPDLPVSWRGIPVRDFLDHTSGVPDYIDNLRSERMPPVMAFPDDLQTVFASLADTPMLFLPGTDMRYTQTNYLVLAAVLAAHYGKPYPQIAEERIVRRLGLHHTWLGPAALSGQRVVKSYIGKDGRLTAEQDIAWPAYAYGHAALYSTPDDLMRFLQAMISGELVGTATLRRLWQPRILPNGRQGVFAAGWEYGESGTYRQVGHDGGTRDRVRILFEDLPDGDVYIVVYLTNGSGRNVWSRTLVDSALAVVAPRRFAMAALSERMVSYALQAPADGDLRAMARSIRADSALGDAALERAINNAGYAIRESLGVAPALRVFELNTVLFPDSANTWDSLAEAHAAQGDMDKAKALYDKARRRPAPVDAGKQVER